MGMYWNHRIMRYTESNGETMLMLAEVFYDDKSDKPYSYGEAFLISETVDGIHQIVAQFTEAAKRPVLSYPEDFDERDDDDEVPAAPV